MNLLETRKGSRICAMQVIYSQEAGGEDLSGTQLMSSEFLTIEEPDPEYMERTVQGVCDHKDELDQMIDRFARGWKAARLPKVDLAILRLGIFEILYREDIPDGATINECVEMAKKYSNPESGSYINGILSSCVRYKLNPDEEVETVEMPEVTEVPEE